MAKSFNYIPSAEESRNRRAAKADRHFKIARAKDRDWKREAEMLMSDSLASREASMMDLLGYTKYNS